MSHDWWWSRDSPKAARGNWIVNTNKDELLDALEWQWEKRLIPYWKEHGKIAADHGVTLCFEMQVNDMVHTPIKLKRLRDEIGPVVACNFDISHMWVQGIDPFEAMRDLGDLIQNVGSALHVMLWNVVDRKPNHGYALRWRKR